MDAKVCDASGRELCVIRNVSIEPLDAYRLVGDCETVGKRRPRLTEIEITVTNGRRVVRRLKGGAAKVTRNGGTGFRVTVEAFA